MQGKLEKHSKIGENYQKKMKSFLLKIFQEGIFQNSIYSVQQYSEDTSLEIFTFLVT